MCKSLNVADVLYIYICCFITEILFSYWWSATKILRFNISYSSQAAYNCYLLRNGMNEQTRRHTSGMTSPLASIADNTEQNSFYIHKMAI